GVRKMSKSYNNYISLNDAPNEMFGKIMSISDELMYRYYELLTQDDLETVKKMHPKEAKVSLAKQIVERYWTAQDAQKAEEEFNKIFAKKDLPTDIEKYACKTNKIKISQLLIDSSMVSSKNEARRLIEQGGVKINSEKINSDEEIEIKNEIIMQAGKRKFRKIVYGG
ncbi:MAG: S4 domain-containing protein, partial [Endomicrobiaceae bacterium]|nr:S4 domain-containing protein [Endomicrobiaceae bacterium]